MKGKVLVTGGCGYIGSVLVDELVHNWYEVIVIDAMYFGESNPNSHIKYIQQDLRDIKDNHLFDNVNAIVHLAGFSNDPCANFNEKANFELNTEITGKLFEIANMRQIDKFIFASSASVYDKGDEGEVINSEDMVVSPKFPYSISKYEAEKILLQDFEKYTVPIIFRQGTVYGYSSRMRFDLVVNTMLRSALVDKKIVVHKAGGMWRPLVDVRDLVEAYKFILDNDYPVPAGIYNLSFKDFRVSEVALKIASILRTKGIDISVEVDNSDRLIRSYRMDISKAQKILHWKPYRTIELSVLDMIDQLTFHEYKNLSHPRYNNIEWLKIFQEIKNNPIKKVW